MTGYVTKKINFPSNFPQGRVMFLSATGGAYPLPYNSDDFAKHTWIRVISTSQRYIEITSNAFWENYPFYFSFLLLDD
jgi:hypothetical protein